VIRRGFILTPHDALCKKIDAGCLWVGPYEIPGTSWRSEMGFSDGKPTGKKSIIFKGFFSEKGTVKGQKEGTESGTDKGQEQGTETLANAGYGVGSVVKSPKTIDKIGVSKNDEESRRSISEAKAGPYPLVSLNREDPLTRPTPEPGGQPPACSSLSHSLTKTGDQGLSNKSMHSETEGAPDDKKPPLQTPSAPSIEKRSVVESALAARPALPPELQMTIAEYFERAICSGGFESRHLRIATDGLLAEPLLDRKTAIDCLELNTAIRQTVEQIGRAAFCGRKTLVEVLNAAAQTYGKKLPRPVFKVLMEMKESGGGTGLALERKRPGNVEHFDVYSAAADLVGIPNGDEFASRLYGDGVKKAESFLDAWWHLDQRYGCEMPDDVSAVHAKCKASWNDYEKAMPKAAADFAREHFT
jgi:hypothetical protein